MLAENGIGYRHNGADSERIAPLVQGLDRIEDEAEQIEVPLSHADQLYNLRLHRRLIREQLREIA
jgi:hypothetical protein